MNSHKKADLQRRLSATPAGKPPADLADRIKRDIPRHFTMNHQTEREQLTRSVSFNMRVAAGVLLVIAAAYISMQLFSVPDGVMTPNSAPLARIAMSERVVADQKKADAPAAPQAQVAQTRAASYDASDPSLAATAKKLNAAPPPPAVPRPMLYADRFRDARERKEKDTFVAGGVEGGVPGGVVGGTVGGVIGGARSDEAPARQLAEAAAPAPPPPPPPAAAAPLAQEVVSVGAPPLDATATNEVAPSVADAQKTRRASAGASPSLVKSAMAADLDLGARDEVFGISVDRTAFDRVKDAIERGERPTTVNVEALVNYFAGPQKTRREVSLETEGSPAPVGGDGHRAILRYTIDTASAAVADGASVPPVASDAKIEVVFDPKAVASHRLIGGGAGTEKAETALLKNTSVTALYEIELKDGLTSRQTVATVRLTYHSVADGREHTATSTIYGRDLARPWRTASRRHRLASLGAVWGETLNGSPRGTDVARRAEELAMQEPKDAKARELASLATASSRLRTSAPTGSGR